MGVAVDVGVAVGVAVDVAVAVDVRVAVGVGCLCAQARPPKVQDIFRDCLGHDLDQLLR